MRPYDLLIEKLDQFIRKYYSNLLSRGVVSLLISCLLFVVLISVGEYYLYFPSLIRLLFWCLFLGLNCFILVQWIIRPLLALFKLGKRLQYEDAALIIGKHFPEIDDKLLNVLQLQQLDHATTSSALLAASIDSGTPSCSPVNFFCSCSFNKSKICLKKRKYEINKIPMERKVKKE